DRDEKSCASFVVVGIQDKVDLQEIDCRIQQSDHEGKRRSPGEIRIEPALRDGHKRKYCKEQGRERCRDLHVASVIPRVPREGAEVCSAWGELQQAPPRPWHIELKLR